MCNNEQMSGMQWRRLSGMPLLGPLEAEVESVILRELANKQELTICIGTDSEVRAGLVRFASVVVFIRRNNGGIMFINKSLERQKMSLKERMIAEVSKSVQIAHSLSTILRKYRIPLEVHADINTQPNHLSSTALKEAMGYIVGMGFTFKAKPDAFASTCCADRLI